MSTHSMQVCIALCALLAIAYADLLTPAFTPYGDCDNFKAETLNEGYCKHRYQDSVGLWTIGIGFNLEQSGAQSIMRKCYKATGDADAMFSQLNAGPNSCNYAGSDSQKISDELAACLLYTELVAEETCVKGILGSQFDSVPKQVRSGMIDMAYNMGCGGLKSFSTMIGLIKQGQYAAAASGARGSKWCSQVHGRCDRTTDCIANKGGSSSPPPPPPPATGSSPPTTGTPSGCVTFYSGACDGPTDCMCTKGESCSASKAGIQSAQNGTETFEAKRRELIAQGKSASCSTLGGTCYKVIHNQCPGTAANCMQAGDRC